MLRGLFEGTQYNSEAGATRTVNSRARTKQGREAINEIWYTLAGSKLIFFYERHFSAQTKWLLINIKNVFYFVFIYYFFTEEKSQ